MEFTSTTLPRKRERVLAQVVDGEAVLLDLDAGTYFGLNEVGHRVWTLCDGSHSVDDIVAVITSEYDATSEQVRADINDLLTDMASDGLIGP